MLWPFDSPTSLSHSVVLIMITRSNERPFLFGVGQGFLGVSAILAGAEFGGKLILDFTVDEFHPVLSELTFTHFKRLMHDSRQKFRILIDQISVSINSWPNFEPLLTSFTWSWAAALRILPIFDTPLLISGARTSTLACIMIPVRYSLMVEKSNILPLSEIYAQI